MDLAHPAPVGPMPGSDDFVVTHIFDAPRHLVWAAFTQSEHLSRWWKPNGFNVLVNEVDPRPDGLFRYVIEAPDGATVWGKLVYRSVSPPHRMLVEASFTDAAGDVIHLPMEPDWPLGMIASTTLEEQGGRTLLTLMARPDGGTAIERQVFKARRDQMKQCFKAAFTALNAHLARIQTT